MLNKENIQFVDRAVKTSMTYRMKYNFPILAMEISDHLICDIEKSIDKDPSLTFYEAFDNAFKRFGGYKMTEKLLRKKSKQTHLELIARILTSLKGSIGITILAILLSSILTGLSEFFTSLLGIKIYTAVFLASLAHIIYKRKSYNISKAHLFTEGMILNSILPYSIISACLYSILDYDVLPGYLNGSVPFLLAFLGSAYLIVRHRALIEMMLEEIDLVQKLNYAS